MKPVLDLSLCFRDSPDYRLDVQKAESVVWQLEQLCKSVVKASKHQQDTGQGGYYDNVLKRIVCVEYCNRNVAVAQELLQLSRLESDDPVIGKRCWCRSNFCVQNRRCRGLPRL